MLSKKALLAFVAITGFAVATTAECYRSCGGQGGYGGYGSCGNGSYGFNGYYGNKCKKNESVPQEPSVGAVSVVDKDNNNELNYNEVNQRYDRHRRGSSAPEGTTASGISEGTPRSATHTFHSTSRGDGIGGSLMGDHY